MLALAERLLAGGHEVALLTQRTFAPAVARLGIEGIYTSEDAREEMTGLAADTASVGNSIKWAQKSLAEEFALMAEASRDADLLVCTNNEFSVSSIAEARDLPAFRVAYLPSIPGENVPPIIPWQNLPRILCRPAWHLINKGLDLMALKTANRERAILGLPPIKSLAGHFMKIYRNLFAINEMLAPPHPSWPTGTYRYCGYAFEDQEDDLPEEVVGFIEAGPPPIYLGFGSVSLKRPGAVTDMVLEAAEVAGCRLVLSRGWTGLGRQDVPAHVLLVDELSHDHLFPRMAAVCHHGGSGTTHRAARAGVPQFIMPIIVDQFFWGKRIHDLCVGPKPRPPRKLSARSLADIFEDLSTNPSYRENADHLAESVSRDGGVDAICDAIVEEMTR